MILIFGGAYQGKLEYAQKNWNFREEDVFYCEDNLAIDLSKKVIYGLHHFCFACACEGADTLSVLKAYEIPLKDKIFILNDILQRFYSDKHNVILTNPSTSLFCKQQKCA